GPCPCRADIQIRRCAPEPQHRLLCDILGFGIIPEHPARYRENRREMPPDNHAERSAIAASRARQEEGVGQGGVIARAHFGPGPLTLFFAPTYRHRPSPRFPTHRRETSVPVPKFAAICRWRLSELRNQKGH